MCLFMVAFGKEPSHPPPITLTKWLKWIATIQLKRTIQNPALSYVHTAQAKTPLRSEKEQAGGSRRTSGWVSGGLLEHSLWSLSLCLPTSRPRSEAPTERGLGTGTHALEQETLLGHLHWPIRTSVSGYWGYSMGTLLLLCKKIMWGISF